jgi:hypothetical protein
MPFSQEKVTDILRAAHEAVTAAGLPEELQRAGFEKAIDLLAGGGSSASPEAPDGAAGPVDPPEGGDIRTLARIASKLGLSVETVGEVFHIEGEALALGLATSMFPAAKATAAQEITLLVAAGRQAGGWDAEWTATSEVRPIVDAYGKLDSGNYAGSITSMADDFSFSGSGVSRRLKVKRKGFENATALVKRLAGEG